MRWCAEQSTNKEKAEECDLGPPLTLEPNLEHFMGESAVTQGVEGGIQIISRALCGELQSLVGVERPPVWHAWLVERPGGHP